jgi:DNA-3-methyladenine glycosylase
MPVKFKGNKFRKLPKEFYIRSSVIVAKELIGKYLFRNTGKGILSGIIVETEAYTGRTDPAAHSYNGKTTRNEVMFREGGAAYVYFTYGNHFCFNTVTGKKNTPSAVLIRGIEPLAGIETMKKNRGTDDLYNLTNGPGKLTKAFNIDKKLNGANLSGNEIYISEAAGNNKKYSVMRSKRIGITKNADKLYRFYVKDNPFVSYAPKKLLVKANKHD